MPVHAHGADRPRIDPSAYIAPGAQVIGNVTIGPRSSVWFNAVVRGDSDAVRIGERSNIQDGAVLHTDAGTPCIVGDRVEMRPAVHHPNLKRPVAYLGGIELAPLLTSPWPVSLPAPKAAALATWLVSNEILVPQ